MASLVYTISDSDVEEVESGDDVMNPNLQFEVEEESGRPSTIARIIEEHEAHSNAVPRVPVNDLIQRKLDSIQDEQRWGQDLSAGSSTFIRPTTVVKEKTTTDSGTFDELNLSRPVVHVLHKMNITQPTPVQLSCVVPALTGKDLLVNAVTGSGKTLAFVLPIIERLVQLSRHHQSSRRQAGSPRVLVLCPTRELAAQCAEVVEQVGAAANPPVRAALIVGGLSEQAQATALRNGPDVAIATPGRMLDHLLNTRGVGLDALDVLVLDEADRLLEMGFIDEIQELIQLCPSDRQTMMFSATMTAQVHKLAAFALRKPEEVAVDPMYSLVSTLTQEFIRVRTNHDNETSRCAILLALCMRSFKNKTIIFFPSKKLAHRVRILFGLAKVSATELHGDLTQTQRLQALEDFKTSQVDILLCTDLASRGLDIKGVETVINYSLPKKLNQYVHRVGRTARAGRGGHAVSLIGDDNHQMLAEVVKRAPHTVKRRKIPQEVVEEAIRRVESMNGTVDEVLRDEVVERELRVAERDATKSQNVIEYQDAILSRPAKVWFQSDADKKDLKQRERVQSQQEKHQELREAKKKEQEAAVRQQISKDQQKQKQDKAKLASKARLETPKEQTQLPKKRVRKYARIEESRDTFANRYKDSGKQDEPQPAKKFKKSASNAFKSKKRYKRRK